MEKKPCGLPPKFPVNSALRAKDVIIEVPDSAVFKCREIGKVTDLGKSIDIQVPAILLTYFVKTLFMRLPQSTSLPSLKLHAQISMHSIDHPMYNYLGSECK